MAVNGIQFQKGLSLPAFLEQFGTEATRSFTGKKPFDRSMAQKSTTCLLSMS